jgi:hypothetical protein
MKSNIRLFVKVFLFDFLVASSFAFQTSSALGLAGNPEFSVNRGFFSESFDLIVSADTIDAKIKYTFDGSDPRTSPTALVQNSPALIRIDPDSTYGQRGKAPAVIVRACTQAQDMTMSETKTHTYLFVDKAGELSPEGIKPGSNWPDPNPSASPQIIDYGMSPDILNDLRYKNLIGDALLSIPTISLVTDLKNMFASDTGIYVNALQDGIAWERPASIELIKPESTKGFQINAGIRIRGGWSRHGDCPKHAFRLFFRSEYGSSKLEYPLFDSEGVASFDKVDLRTGQNYSWSYPGHLGQYNTMISEVFSRDLQREMHQPYTRSRFYHLYINGVYWGLYQTQERAEARFASSYLGGSSDDYDVIKIDDNYNVVATDGNTNAYQEVWNYCTLGFQADSTYFKLQGLNPNGTRNSSYKVLVDIDNLIDYMMVIFYAGNFDSPTSAFGGNQGPNNIYCIYNRNGTEGFKFLAHDAEHTLRTTSGEGPGVGLYENRVSLPSMSVSGFSKFHPQWLHYRLTSNTEYKLRFANHVYKQFFNLGCMTPAKATELFLSRAQEIEMAIIGESARWGNTYLNPAATKDDDWLPAITDIVDNYFPVRTGIVLGQLKAVGLYPTIDPPIFENNGEEIMASSLKIKSGDVLKLVNPNTKGTIRYTIDSQDPRAIGGSSSGSALDGGNEVEVTVNATMAIKARVLNSTTWSALHEIMVFADPPSASVDTLARQLPNGYTLYQNYPNPFNPNTTFRYTLPKRSHVVITLYNTLGQKVATVLDRMIDAGYHESHFDGSQLASGVYFYRMQTGYFDQTKKLLLFK